MYELGVSFGLAHEFRVWFNYSTIVCWYSYRCMTWVLHRTLRFVIVVEKLNCKSTGIFLMESFVDSQDFDIKDRQMQVRYIVEGSYNVDDDKLWQLISVMTFGYLCCWGHPQANVCICTPRRGKSVHLPGVFTEKLGNHNEKDDRSYWAKWSNMKNGKSFIKFAMVNNVY